MLPANEQSNAFLKARRLGKWSKARADGNPDHPVTHTLQNGGVLSIPDDQLHILYEALGDDLASDPMCRFYVTEKSTPTFPMFYDIDLKNEPPKESKESKESSREPEEVRKEAYSLLVGLAREEARSFFRTVKNPNPRLFDTIVCKTHGDFTGIHIYFPNILLDKSRAEIMRYSLVARLQHEARSLVSNWEDVVDESVYRMGLRMPGAQKLQDCSVCKKMNGVVDPNCPGLCDRRGKQCIGRQYRFYALFSDVDDEKTKDHRIALQTNWSHLLKSTSLRRPATVKATPGFVEYPGCARPTIKMRFPKRDELPRSSPAWGLIEQAVRRFAGEYHQLDVQKVFIPPENQKSNRAVFVYVCGKNATYCPNKKGYHNSSRVYFRIIQSGMELRCLCKKNNGGMGRKKCSEFKSHMLPLDREVIDVLFPDNMFQRRAMRSAATSAPNTQANPSNCVSPLLMLQAMHSYTAPDTPVNGYGDINNMHELPNKVRRTSGGVDPQTMRLVHNLTSHLKVIEQKQNVPKTKVEIKKNRTRH